MLRYLVLIIALFLTTPVVAEGCTKFADVIASNPEGSTFEPLNADQLAALKRNVPEIDEEVTSVVIGRLPTDEEDVFLFGFKKDGCMDGHGHVSQQKLNVLLGQPS